MTALNITTEVYISTGAKNAMYTLRIARRMENRGIVSDVYIKNISKFGMKAEDFASQFAIDLQARTGHQVVFGGFDTVGLNERRGKLSAFDSKAIVAIEEGIVPYGKHKGKKFEELEDGYLLWATDELKKQDLKPVFFAFASMAASIANDRGLIAKREMIRNERIQKDLVSRWYGNAGERYTLPLLVEFKRTDDETGYNKYQLRSESGEIFTHNGHIDLPKGEMVNLTFTVKFHNETRNGIKKTYVNRPKILK